MKHFLLALFAVALVIAAVPDVVQAQTNPLGTGYAQTNLDSLVGIRGRVVTDGFGAYKYIENGITGSILSKKMLWVSMPGKTDSVKVQGGILRTINKSATGRVVHWDTVWVDIAVRDIEKKRRLVYGQVNVHELVDTVFTWVSDVGVDKGTTRILAIDDHEFVAYRVVTGINDSTVTKFRLQGRKD